MNELTDFLISNDVNYNEVQKRFIIFDYKKTRYNFDFEIKELHIINSNNYIKIPFNSFDIMKNNCNNYIEIFTDKNRIYNIIIWFDKGWICSIQKDF